jgi:outer membrane protein assembly factor BamB
MLASFNYGGANFNVSAAPINSVVASELWNFTATNHTRYQPYVSWRPKTVGEGIYAVESERYNIPGENHPLLPYGRTIETLYALTSNGTQLWNFTITAILSLKVADKTVYLTAKSSDFDNVNKLFALDIDSGAQKWMFYGWGTIKWYTLADNIMYVAVAHIPTGSAYYLCALNITTGHQIWKQTFAWGDDGPSSFIVNDGLIYFAHSLIGVEGDDEYYALNTTDGTTFWKTRLYEGNFGPSALISGLICFSAHDAVYALNATNGATVWSTPKEQGYFFYPTFSYKGDIIYAVGCQEHEKPTDKRYSKVYALNARDGASLWSYSIGGNYVTGLSGDMYSSLDIIEDTLYILVDYSSLYALNTVSGQQLWNHSGRPQTIDSGTAYFYRDNYQQKETDLEAIDLSNGRSLWNYSSTQRFITAQNNVLYFHESSTLHAMKIGVTSNTETDSSESITPVVVLTVVVIVAGLLTLATVVLRKKKPEDSSVKQRERGFEPSTRWRCHQQVPIFLN